MIKQKIVVAMSAGVDSSTVAAILKNEGHDVIGITLQLYDHGMAIAKKGACCAGIDIYDAAVAAQKIGIPHYVLNYETIFKQRVIDDFADSYLRGETPIPCVKCNQNVKFKDLFKVAQDLGADALATGHYVRRIDNLDKVELHKGIDENKDQSYFLFATTQEQLNYLRFPLGHMNKQKTRLIAEGFGLDVANKPDSQDICFVQNGSYTNIIEKLRPGAIDPGDIIDNDGNVLGRHNGIINFTIGQRRGIGIASKNPLYVLSIDPKTNQVKVGEKRDLQSTKIKVKDINWLGEDFASEYTVKLRSDHEGCRAKIQKSANSEIYVNLLEPYSGVSPGQACVIYDGSRVLGGGWITSLNN